jgi:hypothetical protein
MSCSGSSALYMAVVFSHMGRPRKTTTAQKERIESRRSHRLSFVSGGGNAGALAVAVPVEADSEGVCSDSAASGASTTFGAAVEVVDVVTSGNIALRCASVLHQHSKAEPNQPSPNQQKRDVWSLHQSTIEDNEPVYMPSFYRSTSDTFNHGTRSSAPSCRESACTLQYSWLHRSAFWSLCLVQQDHLLVGVPGQPIKDHPCVFGRPD